MSYSIDELEKAFGVNQENPRQSGSVDENDNVIEKEYIDKMHDQFLNQLQKVGKELNNLEQQVTEKRTEFLKVQGAYEVIQGMKKGMESR